jgi:hypothetical protein
MIRNLKALGLALVAVFALSVVVASAASAQEAEQGLLTSEGQAPVTLTAEETGTNFLTAAGVTVKCPGSTYTGHKYNVTPHSFILSGATKVTITPHIKQENCVAAGIFRMTVHTNGCDYVLNIGETSPIGNDEGTYDVTTDIVCPAEKAIVVTMYTTEPKHNKDEPFCVLHIKEQTGLQGAHATDTGNGHIDIAGTITGVTATRTVSAHAPILCPHTTTSAGEFDIDLTVKAHNEAGKSTAISISDTEDTEEPLLTSDGKVPVTLTGTQNAGTTNALTAFGLTIKCPESTYTGHKYNVTPHSFILNGAAKVTLTPHYKQVAVSGDANCRVTPGNFPATIHTNGCDYVMNIGTTTGGVNTYGVTYDVVCPEGKEVTITMWTTDHEHTTNVAPFCVIHISPQAGVKGGHATDTANGTIDLDGTLEGIKATRTNNTGGADTHTVLCPETTNSVGKFDINLTVKGTNEAGGPTAISLSD